MTPEKINKSFDSYIDRKREERDKALLSNDIPAQLEAQKAMFYVSDFVTLLTEVNTVS